MSKVVLVTGGFDPLHSGHIEYFKAAKELGDHLIVGVNSDAWLTRKKGRPFMSFEERANIIKHLEMVDEVIGFNDDDGTACAAIMQVLSTKGSKWKVVFANGGDRVNTNVPEFKTFHDNKDVEFAWKVGGSRKMNSSSWILENWSKPKTERAWGIYTVLHKGPGWQVKELEFEAGKSLSDQRHFNRSEHWHVIEGVIEITVEDDEGKQTFIVPQGNSFDIPALCWHKAVNVGETPAKVIEVWMGDKLTEDDIERRD
mgnify:CR=1 FL=1|jgi:cytidyltransferase-like protein